MRRLLTGCFVSLLLLLNTLVLIGPLMVFALLKLVAPGRSRDYRSEERRVGKEWRCPGPRGS